MDTSTGDAIARAALGWLGTPYRHQHGRKGVGCDCLGLVRGVWREVYGRPAADPGPYAADWNEAGQGDRLMEAARLWCRPREGTTPERGDLLVFRLRPRLAAKHCAIALDAGRFIHAYQGHAVMISHLDPHWRRRLAGVFQFPER
ncbi:MAG: NlpC/P60 family protein [Mesorhizobium sp.]